MCKEAQINKSGKYLTPTIIKSNQLYWLSKQACHIMKTLLMCMLNGKKRSKINVSVLPAVPQQ